MSENETRRRDLREGLLSLVSVILLLGTLFLSVKLIPEGESAEEASSYSFSAEEEKAAAAFGRTLRERKAPPGSDGEP